MCMSVGLYVCQGVGYVFWPGGGDVRGKGFSLWVMYCFLMIAYNIVFCYFRLRQGLFETCRPSTSKRFYSSALGQ